MSEKVNKSVFAKNAIWKMAETIFTRGITTVISIVLARLLMPSDYGILAFTSVFLNISTMIVQGGIDTALIRLDTVDDEDYSNAFLFSLFVSGGCYLLLFILAPFIARYYGEALIAPVIRVQMLSLFLCSFAVVRTAIITRQFQFNKIFYINGVSSLVGGIFGILMAYLGWGVWALVLYTLISNLISCILMFFVVRWKMVWKPSFKRIKKMFSFSSWILVTAILDFCGNNIFNTVFGKKYSMTDLGYYNKGNQLPELICLNTYGALTSVLLPTLSIHQNDNTILKSITRKVVRISSFVIFPMMMGLAMIGENIVKLLFTEKWLPCVPVLMALSLYYGVNIFRQVNMQILYAKGESKTGAFIHFIRFISLIIMVVFCTQVLDFSVSDMAFASAIMGIIIVLITQFYSKKYIGYGYIEWVKDIFPALFMSIIMGVIVYLVGYLHVNYIISLVLQIICGVIVYLVMTVLSKNESLIDIKGILQDLFYKKKEE